MNSWTLLPEEVVVAQFVDNRVNVTNMRVLYVNGKNVGSIPLDKISMIQVVNKSNALYANLTILAFLAAAIGVIMDNPAVMTFGALVTVLAGVIYMLSRKYSLMIHSTGSGYIRIDKAGSLKAEGFINTIDKLRTK